MNKKIENFTFTVIGGGTGTFSVLTGLKNITENIKAVVNMIDSGGSARKERDEWGVLPSSDLRKSLIALADISTDDSLLLRKLFQYRYSEGKGISGMTFGNLFLVALTKLLDSQKEAIKKAGQLLKIKGEVIPVTMDKANLVAEYQNGIKVVGEHFIDEPKHDGALKIDKIYTQPQAYATKEALQAIRQADCLILGPGGFYTTIVANLVVKGIPEEIKKSKAIKIFIMNLMTEWGQTYNFRASEYISQLNKFISENTLDYILINNSPLPEIIIKRYKKYHTKPVINDLPINKSIRVITTDLLSDKIIKKEKGDRLKRSLIRHDPDKLVTIIKKLCNLV